MEISKIGFFTGLCWSASFLIAMYSLTNPAWGFAGNLIGMLSIWVAGVQLRAFQMLLPADAQPWNMSTRWQKSIMVQLLAAVLCTFVQYIYFRFVDGGRLLTIMTETYNNPAFIESMKEIMPEYKPEMVLDMLSQISLTSLTMNFLIINVLLALLLSVPTAFVARPRVITKN